MRINLEVELQDGTKHEVTASAIDVVKFEETFDLSFAKLQSEMKMTHLFFLAHAALLRQKKTTQDFKSWMETVEDVGASAKDPK